MAAAVLPLPKPSRNSLNNINCYQDDVLSIELEARNHAQVSINLAAFEKTPVHRVFQQVRFEAEKHRRQPADWPGEEDFESDDVLVNRLERLREDHRVGREYCRARSMVRPTRLGVVIVDPAKAGIQSPVEIGAPLQQEGRV